MVYGKRCCVPTCEDKNSIRHRFPPVKETERFNIWLQSVNNPILENIDKKVIYDKFVICRRHFENKYFTHNNRLHRNAVPTLNLEPVLATDDELRDEYQKSKRLWLDQQHKENLKENEVLAMADESAHEGAKETSNGARKSDEVLVHRQIAAPKHSCSVLNCSEQQTLYQFPNPRKDSVRFVKWVKATGNSKVADKDKDTIFRFFRLCSKHFEAKLFKPDKTLSLNAVPTVNLPAPVTYEHLNLINLANEDDKKKHLIDREVVDPLLLDASDISLYETLIDGDLSTDADDLVTLINNNILRTIEIASKSVPIISKEIPTEIEGITIDEEGTAKTEEDLTKISEIVVDERVPTITEDPSTVFTIESMKDKFKNSRNEFCLNSENIGNICRACLKETEVKNLYENTFENISFGDILEICSPIKINKEESLSQNICDQCIIELVRSYMFRQKCKKSEDTLREFKEDLDKAEKRLKLLEEHRKKLQLLDHDYEQTNDEEEVKGILKLHKSRKKYYGIGELINQDMLEDSGSKYPTRPKYIKRFYMIKGNIDYERAIDEIDNNLIEINEKKARMLLKNSSKIYPKIVYVGNGKNQSNLMDVQPSLLSNGSEESDSVKNSSSQNIEDDEENNFGIFDENKENVYGTKDANKTDGLSNSANISSTMQLASPTGTNKVINRKKFTIKYSDAIKKAIKLVLQGRLNEAKYLARNPIMFKASSRKRKAKLQKPPRIPVPKQEFPGKCKICDEPYINRDEYTAHCKLTKHYFTEYPCEVCGKVYSSKYCLRTHLRAHNNERPYMCEKCGSCFSNTNSLSSHMKTHSELKKENYLSVCKLCGKSYLNRIDLARHRRIAHFIEKTICCEICGVLVTGKGSLLQHKKRIHMNLKPQKCIICGKGFYTKANLRKHMLSHNDEQYNCKLCNFYFKYKSRLAQHMKYRHPGANENVTLQEEVLSIECPCCKELCQNKQAISIHLSETHGNLLCNYCDHFFDTVEEFKEHCNTHSDIKDYSCRYCGRVFPSWDDLYLHLGRHNDRSHECPTCQRKFSSKQKLNRHNLIHTKAKSYTCQYCQKSFIYSTSKIIHERIHTGERPYVCDICGKGCMCSSSLKRHKISHIPPREVEINIA